MFPPDASLYGPEMLDNGRESYGEEDYEKITKTRAITPKLVERGDELAFVKQPEGLDSTP